MSKKTNKKLSRQEPTTTKVSVAPAGTPTAPSAPAVPAAVQQTTPAVGESLPNKTYRTPEPGEDVGVEFVGSDSKDVVSAIEPEVKKEVKPAEQPRGGAAFWIPPQKPSVFGKQE